ncbi:MAG TPA: hypothetical protein VIM64_01900, partial [Puia sp.]
MSHLKTLFFCLLSLSVHQLCAQSQSSVSFEKWLSLQSAGGVVLSSDGAFAAYTVSTTDWKDNSYVNEIWIAQKGQKPFQLTRTPKSGSSSPVWSPDSRWRRGLPGEKRICRYVADGMYGLEPGPFTRQYLKATRWEDRAIYEKTSPMAAINQATTPTQIQHGELDRRVPISDAHELYR